MNIRKVKKSIKYKFILYFLIVSILPFTLLITISTKIGKETILNNVYEDLKNQTSSLVRIINLDLENIQRQIKLWSKFQILDDIMVGDIDKRVQNFIENIKINTQIKGILLCTNQNGNIIASTDKDLIGKKLNLEYVSTSFTDLHKFPLKNHYALKFSYPIFASFNKEKHIGYFILIYYTENMLKYLNFNEKEFSLLLDKDKIYFVGQSIEIFDKPLSDFGILNIPGYVVVYQRIKNNTFKDKWYFVSAIDEKYVFKPINRVNDFLLIIGIAGIFLILGTSIFFANKIVKPIEKLSNFTKYITLNKDYNKTIIVDSEDEIGVLANSFNEMISEINKAFNQLEKESLDRLKLFLKLTETFNKITTAKNIQQVFDIVNTQLQDFPYIKDIGFSATKVENAINIAINTEEIKGYLFFRTDIELSDKEKRFLKSIGTFVNLWIERIELIEKATQSSKAKSTFIANISHELRTPLNSIIGFAQFLQMVDDMPDKYKEIAKNIENSGKHLLNLINEILEFSKADAGKIKVNKITTNINSIVTECINSLKPLSQEKNIKFVINAKNNIMFKTDPKLLRQILLNLLSNAIKFTPEGYIKISLKLINGKLFIRVKDTGIGIEKEDLKKLFHDFTQLENPLQKKYKGTGLGLSITKRYIQILNGNIKVYSKGKGKGTEFIFYIS